MKNIKSWYESTYPTDELGQEINPDATFEELLVNIPSVYEYLKVGDSVVRERVFQQLAEMLKVEYNVIYEYWLNQTDRIIKLSDVLTLFSTEELKEEINKRGWYFHSWCNLDIESIVEDRFEDDKRLIDNPLNDDDMHIILEEIFDNHDANEGINWDVLYYGVDNYLDDREQYLKLQNTPQP